MSRVAFFVDAGYLFAQGSAALAGEKRMRSQTTLNESALLAELYAVAKAKCDGVRALRTYWYDAAPGSRLTTQQAVLANTDYVKMRLGALNGKGQQKGVDSLIVTDMIELARLNSISDAVLLSGDEDVRIGVQIAQTYGVSVHLIGIHPARGSQSPALRQEADTNSVWNKDIVSRFLEVIPLSDAIGTNDRINDSTTEESKDEIRFIANKIIDEMIAEIDFTGNSEIQTFLSLGKIGLPSDIDRPFLGKLGAAAGRRLEQPELRLAREEFVARLKAKLKS